MNDWSYDESCFYFDELQKSMNEAIAEFGTVLMYNLHNEQFDAEEAQHNILIKYFPEVYNKQTTP